MIDVNLKIRMIIKDKLGVDDSVITNEATFYDDLGVDSLDFCEVIVDIEKAFDITIPDEICAKLKTVISLVNYVSQQVYQPA
jgi:acyl carrier protein